MKTLNLIITLTILLATNLVKAQDAEIDASKPTNFYSFLDNTFEYQSTKTANIMGYRGNLTLAPSESHLILAEIPLLFNDATNKFGLGDVRARYFYLPYKNYDKFVGAFGPSLDVFAPTGNFENGLGSDSWIIAPGVTVGLMAHEKIQFFPILSYQYKSMPISDAGKAAGLTQTHGLTFQVITPIVFNDNFFMQLTPNFRVNDLKNAELTYVQEVFAAYTIKPGLQATAYYQGNFKEEINTFRIGATIYF